MASRKEEKERLRQAREQAEAADRKQERKRLVLGYVVAGVISLAVVVGIVYAVVGGSDSGGGSGGGGDRLNESFGGVLPKNITVDDRESAEAPSDGNTVDLEEAAEAAGCELLREQKDEGATHIPESDGVPDYEANPPTSGDHNVEPLADGAFVQAPSPLNYIHSLEHGRIQIQYSSELPQDEQLQLLGLYDEDPAGMVVFPNDDMPYLVAATAWRQTLGCDSYEGAATLDAFRAFRSEFRARGPEPIAMN
ncbi:MAG TPA: DUF3105 domain-containing protein [Solirubrobacterales bacterium]|nr:DUF3105 domain-containing protein [Solirubrobacterales bacterium]